MLKKNHNILIRRIDNLGDIVIALPVVREIKNNFPYSKIHIMVQNEHRPLFYKYSDNFVEPIELQSLYTKKKYYDLIFNIEYSLPKRYNPSAWKRNRIIHIGTANWDKDQQFYKHLLDGLSIHGFKANYSRPKVFVSPVASKFAKLWMKENNFNKKDFNVVINPGSKLRSKIYNTENFESVCKWLIKTFKAKITIVSKKCNDKEAKLLFNKLPDSKKRFLCAQEIDRTSAVMSQHDLLIGNDSGTSHLAAALNVPTVTIFKVTPPGLWMPAGNKSIIVQKRKSTYSNPSNIIDKQLHKYFNTITVNDVSDGILLAIVKNIGLGKKECFQKIRISRNTKIQFHNPGVIVKNMATQHSFYVSVGWKYIEKLFFDIKKLKQIRIILKKYPDELDLINFLILHRIIEFQH